MAEPGGLSDVVRSIHTQRDRSAVTDVEDGVAGKARAQLLDVLEPLLVEPVSEEAVPVVAAPISRLAPVPTATLPSSGLVPAVTPSRPSARMP
jgi:hypothetical protein